MDPLSIAAAAVGFLAALETTTKKLRDVSRKLHDSATVKATLELGQQLIQLEFVTRSLLDREIPTIGGSSNASAISVVQQIKLNIQSCQADLEELSGLLDRLDNSLKEKARWVFKTHEKAMGLCESLNRHYNSLDLSLSTILILTTHQTHVVTDQTLQETDHIKEQVNLTREVAQDVKGDTTHLKKCVEQVGQSVDQMGYDVSEMLTLLRKFDQHKSWPFRGHSGFVTTDLCFSLERYFRDQSGIDTEELRSQFSSFRTEDDVGSLLSGWTWGESKQGAPDSLSTSQSRYGRKRPIEPRPAQSSSTKHSAGERGSKIEMSQDHIALQSLHDIDTRLAQSSADKSLFQNTEDEAAEGGHQRDGSSLAVDVGQVMLSGMEDSDVVKVEPSESEVDFIEGSVSTPSLIDSQSQITSSCISELSTKESLGYLNPRESLQTLWDELASDEARKSIRYLRSESAIRAAQSARKRLPSRLAQRRLYEELHRVTGTSGSTVEHIMGLLEQGANPNLPQGQVTRFRQFHTTRPGYAPPLYLAIKNRNIPVIRCLLEYGAEPDCHLVEQAPLEMLLEEAKTDTSDCETIPTIALILASNGARISPSIISHAICLDGVAGTSSLLVIKLLLESDRDSLQHLDLQKDLLSKSTASRVDELLVETLLEPSLEPNCVNICSAIELRNPKILSLLLENLSSPASLPLCMEKAVHCQDEVAVELLITRGLQQPSCSNICLAISLGVPQIVRLLINSLPCPNSLPLCMKRALDCWDEMTMELLMARGTPAPLEAVYRAIEAGRPGLFAKFVESYCREGSGSLNLQRCLYKAIAYWNVCDSTIVQHLISMGAQPTEEQMTTIIEQDDIKTINILLEQGKSISDFRFSCAGADLASRILRSAAKNTITVEKKREKLDIAFSAILSPSKKSETNRDQPDSLASVYSDAETTVRRPEMQWSRGSTLVLIKLLMQEKVYPDDDIILTILTREPLDTELALVVLSEIEEISDNVWSDIIQYGELDRVEFLLLNLGGASVDVSFLLEAALETSSYWRGKNEAFRYKRLPCLDGSPMSLSYDEADDEIKDKMSARAEDMSLLMLNYWLRAAPTPLEHRALEFLVESLPDETQVQVISRCKHHPVLPTIQLLLQYSGVTKNPLRACEALNTCESVLDNETLKEGELASWSKLLVVCLGLRFSVASSEAVEVKFQCLELILCNMEEKGMEINESLSVDLRTPFSTIFTHCPAEELQRTVELFCKYGADPNRSPVDEPSDLPLIIAAEQARGEVITIMVEFGGDLLKALQTAVAEKNIRAMRGGLIEESIKMGILSRHTKPPSCCNAGNSLESDANVLDLFISAINTKSADVLDALFDSGLKYCIDCDLEFLGSVAEFFYSSHTIPEWAKPSPLLNNFCTWWADPAERRRHQSNSYRRPAQPLYLKTSIILEMVKRDLTHDGGEILSRLLKRGTRGDVKPHPSTEYLLSKVADKSHLLVQLIELKIPLRDRTWKVLKPESRRHLWEHHKWALGESALANGSLHDYVNSRGRREVDDADVLAFFFDNATHLGREVISMSFLDRVFDDYRASQDRVGILSSLFGAISRLDANSLPAFQFFALSYTPKGALFSEASQSASQVAEATIKAKINTSQAALLSAAESHEWDLVRAILAESVHDLGSRLSFDDLVPPPRPSVCRHLKGRSYFCRCTEMHKCIEPNFETYYRGNSVLFHAVQDGVVDIVKLAMNQRVSVNVTYHWGKGNGGYRRFSATLLHLAVFCCVDGPIREDRLEILRLLVQNGAKSYIKVEVPNRFLKASSTTDPVKRGAGDGTLLSAEEFAKMIYIPEERQDKTLALWRKINKGSSSGMGLRETICEIILTKCEEGVIG